MGQTRIKLLKMFKSAEKHINGEWRYDLSK